MSCERIFGVMKRFLFVLAVGWLSCCFGAAEGPGEYTFANASVKATWREQVALPADCVAVSPTCVYSVSAKTVYLLAELTGIGEGYETEFILLGPLSDRAYEGLAMAWDAPSVVSRAVKALGVSQGVAAEPLRGLAMAQGERFTMSICRLKEAEKGFLPLSEFLIDACSTPAQNLLGRGFPFVGATDFDDLMPASIIAAYTEKASTFGLPFYAAKGTVYGQFRAKTAEEEGAPAVVALKWEQLATPRVYHAKLHLTAAELKQPEKMVETLKGFCDDPRDVFLQVTFDEALTVVEVAPLAKLFLALEAEGGFTLTVQDGYLPIRAFVPQESWRIREERAFQPWEMEFELAADGGTPKATLCQILEDWTVEGNDPALTRTCYPGVTPQTVLNVMKQVDVNDGKIYVVFFYCPAQQTIGSLLPYARVLSEACPTQWVFVTPGKTSGDPPEGIR